MANFQKKHEYFLAAQKSTGGKGTKARQQQTSLTDDEGDGMKGGMQRNVKVPPLEKYFRDQGVSTEDIKRLDEQITALGEAADFKDEYPDKLELLGKVEQLFIQLVEKRQMGYFYGKQEAILGKERVLKEKRKEIVREQNKQAEERRKLDKKMNMEKKEERQKNAGLDNGKKFFPRSKKPKLGRGPVKQVIENQEE